MTLASAVPSGAFVCLVLLIAVTLGITLGIRVAARFPFYTQRSPTEPNGVRVNSPSGAKLDPTKMKSGFDERRYAWNERVGLQACGDLR